LTAQEVKFSNFYESTLNGILASGATSMTLTAAPTSDGTSNIAAPYYLVIDPDNASNREVVLVTAASGTTVSVMTRDVEGRHTTDPTHVDGTVVRMAVIKEMFEDVHDRVDDLPTASSTTSFTNKTISDSTNTIDAAVIADKSVSNTEFQFLNNASSNIQSQIDGITAGTASQTISITLKVADDGSGSQNVFYFLSGSDSGAGTREIAVDLKVGFKYKFDQADSSNTGHPFRFSLTKDGTHNSGSEFTTNVTTNGTPGSAGAYTQIEITPETVGRNDDNTPKLYYYCTAHSGMGGEGQLTLTTNNLQNYVEKDVMLSSSSGVVAIDLANGNTGSLTLTENVTDIDFTNVPTNGVSSFTVKVTQDASSAYTVAINAITVNGGSDVTAKTAGASGFTMTATLSAEDLLFFLFFDAGTPYLTAQQEMS
jgi:hypothetical protein